nr:ATP-binding cassette transporter Abcb1-like1/3/4 [Brachionus angularis]
MNIIINTYILVGLASFLLNYLVNICWNTACERQIKKMRHSILRQDMLFFDKNTPGDLSSVLLENIEVVKLGIGFKFSDFLSMLTRGIACFCLAIFSAWKFSIVFIFIGPLIIITSGIMVTIIKKYTIKELKSYSNAAKISQEILISLRTVLALGIEKKAIKKYSNSLEEAENMAKKKGLLVGIFAGASYGLTNCMFAVGIYYGVYLIRTDCENYNVSRIIQSFFCIITTVFSIAQALPFLKDLAEAKGAYRKILEIIDTESCIDILKTNEKKLYNFKGNIEFENISFNYPQRPDLRILNNFNLKIPAGKTIALVGYSGGGKSTIFSLLQRFYLINSGSIKLDDDDIQTLDLNWLRNQMSLVSQEPALFTTSIKENIRLGRLDATDSEIEEAAKNANAHDFIMSLANKYETKVGERGTHLSGGQKQRIAIARALIRNPKIFLLDEATSALDYESEKIVQEALEKAKIGRTTIIIAHRLSTIKNADLIAYISDGVVKEQGTHEELIELKGKYYDMINTQNKTKEDENLQSLTEKEKYTQDSSESEAEVENKDELEIHSFLRKKSFRKSQIKNKELNKKQNKGLFYYERKLFKMQKPELIWLILGTISQLTYGAVFPCISLLFSEIFRIFSLIDPIEQEKLSLKYMSLIFCVAITNFTVNIIFGYSFSLSGARLTKRIRSKMFESMLRQEVGFHDLEENRSSVLASSLSSSAPFCRGLTSDKLSLLSQGFSGVGFSIILALYLNWKLCLVMLIFVPISFLSGVLVGRSTTNTKVKGKYSNEEGGRLTIETVDNIKTVVSLNREMYFLNEFKSLFRFKVKKLFAILHLQAFFYSLSNSLLFFIQATAFGFGFYLVKYENLEVTNLFRIYSTLTFSSMILGRVYSLLPDQKKSLDSAKTVFKIIDRKSKIDPFENNGLKLDKVIGNIRFENVFFSYPNRASNQILKGLNLTIKNGETNALVGPSGCGKSTIVSLLLRFYDVDSGSIYLDDVDLKKLNLNWLRSKIGVVSQEPLLFNTSILENILYGDVSRENIEISEVIDVATLSNIHNKIESLPQKYDTLVGFKGAQLSGGEKQRISISRALIRKPCILLLDEATSALDNMSEQIVQDALDKAQQGRTCVIIAHRLTTIQNSNKISVVKDGQIIEEGTHLDLMKNKNFYFSLQSKNL